MERQLPAYARAMATQDPSQVCNLHHSSQQCQILNPRSKARDQTCNFMVPSWICFRCARMGTPLKACFCVSLFIIRANASVSLLCWLFAISWAAPTARGQIGAIATGLCQSHSNIRSELCLLHHSSPAAASTTPQLTAMPAL